jgi:hypothetical protein
MLRLSRLSSLSMSRRVRPRGGPEEAPPDLLRTRRRPMDPTGPLDRDGARRGALKGD